MCLATAFERVMNSPQLSKMLCQSWLVKNTILNTICVLPTLFTITYWMMWGIYHLVCIHLKKIDLRHNKIWVSWMLHNKVSYVYRESNYHLQRAFLDSQVIKLYRDYFTSASAPEDTRIFKLLENANPVMRFWWPFSFVLTYQKMETQYQIKSNSMSKDCQSWEILPHPPARCICEWLNLPFQLL